MISQLGHGHLTHLPAPFQHFPDTVMQEKASRRRLAVVQDLTKDSMRERETTGTVRQRLDDSRLERRVHAAEEAFLREFRQSFQNGQAELATQNSCKR